MTDRSVADPCRAAGRIRSLEKAGALIAAEIDRLQRAGADGDEGWDG